MLLHDVFMRKDVGATCTAFEMAQCVILAGIGLDHFEAGASAMGANVLHELKK